MEFRDGDKIIENIFNIYILFFMSTLSIILIALGLAMDAFAVSIANGISIKKLTIWNSLKTPFFFGSFQVLMPIIGWLAGTGFQKYISGIDHWIAFGLLTFIGIKMIYESVQLDPEDRKYSCQNLYGLIILSLATSIDALAVGLSFAFLKVTIIKPLIFIGTITFILSYAGNYIGKTIGHFFEKKAEIAGGLVLIGIGIKILIDHFM